MTLTDPTHSPQFPEWHYLWTTTQACFMYSKCFLKITGQITINFVYLTFSNFEVISHINYWDQNISLKIFRKFLDGLLYRNNLGPSPIVIATAYCTSSNTENCANKLPQIFPNSIDNGRKGIGLRICVMYWMS